MENKITLLVIDSDKKYTTEITDYAKNKREFLDVEYAQNGLDGLELTKIIKPSAVVIDFFVPQLDAIAYLRHINNIYSEKDRPLVLIYSSVTSSQMQSIALSYKANYFMTKPQPPSEICNTIIDLLSSENSSRSKTVPREADNIDVSISRFIHCMGIPAHLNGYNYIREALKLAMDDINVLNPITRKLYPIIAQKFNKTPYCVERAIRHAIKVSWTRGNKKVIYDIFGYNSDSNYLCCPTNSEYIAMLADDLRLRLKHNIAI